MTSLSYHTQTGELMTGRCSTLSERYDSFRVANFFCGSSSFDPFLPMVSLRLQSNIYPSGLIQQGQLWNWATGYHIGTHIPSNDCVIRRQTIIPTMVRALITNYYRGVVIIVNGLIGTRHWQMHNKFTHPTLYWMEVHSRWHPDNSNGGMYH